jgi:hypothetical protein
MTKRTSPTASTKKSELKLTPKEVAIVRKLYGKLDEQGMRLKISNDGNASKIELDYPSQAIGNLLFMHSIGTADLDFANGIVSQLAGIAGKDEQKLNFLLSVIKGFNPRDQMEAMISALIGAAYETSMMSARRLAGAVSLDDREIAARNFNRATGAFTSLTDALKRYRTGGPQNVTLQHVNVSEGGQAIVANVTQNRQEATSEHPPSSPPPLTH